MYDIGDRDQLTRIELREFVDHAPQLFGPAFIPVGLAAADYETTAAEPIEHFHGLRLAYIQALGRLRSAPRPTVRAQQQKGFKLAHGIYMSGNEALDLLWNTRHQVTTLNRKVRWWIL